jgi:hypothetical protein
MVCGHPLLTRLACSQLNTILSSQEKPINISKDTFSQKKSDVDKELVFYCGHVVSELREFYEDEYSMLELLSTGQLLDFKELASNFHIKHLISYGIVESVNNGYSSKIPVVSEYVAFELAKREKRDIRYKIISRERRENWLKRRLDDIVSDVRILERSIEVNNRPAVFGVPSFPEADKFKDIKVVENKGDFTSFINVFNRCFVESIDIYGKSISKPSYFWSDVKIIYPNLFGTLHRVRVYRNDSDHLELNQTVKEKYLEFLNQDLDGKPLSQVEDSFFVLQQKLLDYFLYNIQIEISNIS